MSNTASRRSSERASRTEAVQHAPTPLSQACRSPNSEPESPEGIALGSMYGAGNPVVHQSEDVAGQYLADASGLLVEREAATINGIERNIDDVAHNYSDFLRDTLGSGLATPTVVTDEDTRADTWDLFSSIDQPFTDIWDLSMADLQPLDTAFLLCEDSTIQTQALSEPFENIASTAASQAFRTSGWDWGPSHQDSTSAETRHLIFPPGYNAESSHDKQPPQVPLLRNKDRNRLLSLLLQYCGKEQWISIAPTFPSELFLDQLLRRFLASQRRAVLPWFHDTRLSPDSLEDAFLASVIAIGASLTPSVPVQRFGYCMPEILRCAVVDHWTQDNATSRDNLLLHAWITQAEVSTWSGNRRQMEIGESNYQQAITIIRRARWLRRDHYKRIVAKLDDENEALHRKWRDWVAQESLKRLIYRAFILDMRLSILNYASPLMSYAEMRVPLPDPNTLWWANTAEEWREESLRLAQSTSNENLALVDAIKMCVNGEEPTLDNPSVLYTLFAFWVLVWQHQQLHALGRWGGEDDGDSNGGLSGTFLAAPRDSLQKGLHVLHKIVHSTRAESSAKYTQSALLLEYLSMVICVPLQALHAFAGRDGEKEARRSYPILEEWAQTREARKSVWHAAQIFKLSRRHVASDLNDTCATVLYQASVTLWVYGIIMSARRSRKAPSSTLVADINQDGMVWLDHEMNAAARKFFAISEGTPVLQQLEEPPQHSRSVSDASHSGAPCPIEDASGTMNIAVHILQRPSSAGDGRLGIVTSKIRLMTELAKTARMLDA